MEYNIQIYYFYFYKHKSFSQKAFLLTALDCLTHKPNRSSPHPASPEETQIREEWVTGPEVLNDFDLSSAP